MDMNQAAVFLAGSILTAMGFIVIIIAAIVVNNLFHKFWKPVTIFTPDSWRAFNPPHPTMLEEVKNERPQEKRDERSKDQ